MRSLAAILAPFACACATSKVEAPARRPVLLIHGLDDTARGLRPMFDFLVARGWRDVQAIELTPNDGSSGLIALAEQVDRAARVLVERTAAREIDVVAFSMGALVARYWMKRLNPPPVAVKTYVS